VSEYFFEEVSIYILYIDYKGQSDIMEGALQS
jgi:hypothetical protein